MYADYEYYENTYYGYRISEDVFNRYATWASDWIDCYTEYRISETTDGIKKAMCAVADLMYMDDISVDSESRNIQSETVGKHTTQYLSSITQRADIQKTYKEAFRRYVNDVELISRAVEHEAY